MTEWSLLPSPARARYFKFLVEIQSWQPYVCDREEKTGVDLLLSEPSLLNVETKENLL